MIKCPYIYSIPSTPCTPQIKKNAKITSLSSHTPLKGVKGVQGIGYIYTHARGKARSEADITRDIRLYLATLPNCFYWKEHGGQFGTKGIPDLIVCYNGRFIALEVKTTKGKPTVLQEVTIRKIKMAGGIAGIVRSVADVKAVLGNG